METISDFWGVDVPIFQGAACLHHMWFPLLVMSNFNRPGRRDTKTQSESVAYGSSQPDQNDLISLESAARLSFTELHTSSHYNLDWWAYLPTSFYKR